MNPAFALARVLLLKPDFAALVGCNLLLGLTYAFVMPFLSLFFTREVGLSPHGFGLFMTVSALSGIALSTWLARWSDLRLSRKSMLLIGGVTGTVGHFIFAFSRDAWVLFFTSAILLGLSSVSFSQLFAYARDLLGRSGIVTREIPLYMNAFRLCFSLAWTVGPALSAYCLRLYDFEGAYVVAGSLFAGFTAIVLWRIPATPPSEATRKAAENMPLKQALRVPGLMGYFIAFTLFACATTMGMMNLPLLLVKTLGGHEGHVGITYSIAPVFEIPFMYYLGRLAMRKDTAYLLRASMLLAFVYYAALFFVQAPWHVYPLQILSAAVIAVTSGLAITFFQDFLPDQTGTSTNLFSNTQRIGSLVGYLVFGGISSALGHRAVFVACGVLSLAAWGIMRVSVAPKRNAVGG
jgi:MFS transporter, SET family, sugar efflux transporter